MEVLNTPVLFIIFNREHETKLAFDAIRKVQPRHLFVAADGPRSDTPEDIDKCKATREIIKIDWECNAKFLFHEKNLGCGKGPSTAFSWFFSNVKYGIILEDDCIAEPDFFRFCEELLIKFESNEKIFSINGSNLGYNPKIEYSYFKSRIMNMWGWATWKRTADMIDYDLNYWKNTAKNKNKLFKKLRHNFFDYDYNWISFWDERIKETLFGQNVNWWDYQWILNQIQNKLVSIVPSKNLVKNIGFDNNATHTKSSQHAIAFLDTYTIAWPLNHPPKLKEIPEFEDIFIKENWFYCKRLTATGTARIILIELIKLLINKVLGIFGFEFSITKKNKFRKKVK